MHPGSNHETVLVLDGAGYASGHHGPFLHGVLSVLDRHDIPTVVCGPGSADPSVWGERPWKRAERASLRSLIKGRRIYQQTMAWGQEQQATKFIDLNLDRTLLRYSRRATRRYSVGVAVLHGVKGFSRTTTGGIATRLRRGIERRSLSRLGRNPDIAIVVHTLAAQRELAALGVRAHLVGVPVRSLPRPVTHPPDGDSFLLYIGDGRSEKGLAALLEAMRRTRTPLRLRVAGSLDDRKRAALSSAQDLPIEDLGRVSDEQLGVLFATATATVLPYQPSFRDRAAASTVLLEAIGAGCPVVLPDWMVEQVPPGFRGFLSARDSSPQALADAIDQLPAEAGRLEQEANAFGPEMLADQHSFDSYTSQLIALLK